VRFNGLATGATNTSLAAAAELVRPVTEQNPANQRIGGETAAKLAAAWTPMDPTTRNAAVKLAARKQGPFHVEQVAEIWSAVRTAWRYVNDPEGREYFATASETIQNGYVGDCDDFAITLASMVTAVGGKARIVLMDGPGGGHAYAEACVQGDPTNVASALVKQYKNRFRKYIVGTRPSTIAYRTSDACPIWLNLDWNSNVPGGSYVSERWAVAIYEDGRSEALSPANPVPDAGASTTGALATGATKN
jgi:transglutaminase-like putative cysteine protease